MTTEENEMTLTGESRSCAKSSGNSSTSSDSWTTTAYLQLEFVIRTKVSNSNSDSLLFFFLLYLCWTILISQKVVTVSLLELPPMITLLLLPVPLSNPPQATAQKTLYSIESCLWLRMDTELEEPFHSSAFPSGLRYPISLLLFLLLLPRPCHNW